MLSLDGIHLSHSDSNECASPHLLPSTLSPILECLSCTITSIFGLCFFREAAAVNPAIPPPMISTLILYHPSSIYTIFQGYYLHLGFQNLCRNQIHSLLNQMVQGDIRIQIILYQISLF